MEILLALSLTIVIIGLGTAGLISFSRANTASTALEGLNVIARTLEGQLERDLVLLSRDRTFTESGGCPRTVSSGQERTTRLVLINELDGSPYTVEYAWDQRPSVRQLTRRVVGASSPALGYGNVASFHVGCLNGGQVTATALVRESVQGANAAVGQQVDVRASAAVRMR